MPPALSWAALDPARSPAELALSLAAFVAVVVVAGYLARIVMDGRP